MCFIHPTHHVEWQPFLRVLWVWPGSHSQWLPWLLWQWPGSLTRHGPVPGRNSKGGWRQVGCHLNSRKFTNMKGTAANYRNSQYNIDVLIIDKRIHGRWWVNSVLCFWLHFERRHYMITPPLITPRMTHFIMTKFENQMWRIFSKWPWQVAQASLGRLVTKYHAMQGWKPDISLWHTFLLQVHIEGLAQDCSISIANALEFMVSTGFQKKNSSTFQGLFQG